MGRCPWSVVVLSAAVRGRGGSWVVVVVVVRGRGPWVVGRGAESPFALAGIWVVLPQ